MAAESVWIWVDQGAQDRDEARTSSPLGLALRVAGAAGGGRAQAGEQLGGRAATDLGVTAEELGQAPLARRSALCGGG